MRPNKKRRILIISVILIVCIFIAIFVVYAVIDSKRCQYYATECTNPSLPNTKYCIDHICLYPDCTWSRLYDNIYCAQHVCDAVLCDEKVVDGSEYCYEHRYYSDDYILTLSDAKSYAEKELLGDVLFELRLRALANYANEIKYLEVASIKETDKKYGYSYSFIAKGNFFAYDDYGNLEGIYNFEVEVDVKSDGEVIIDMPYVTEQ